MAFWNQVAPTYENKASGRSKKRVAKVIEMLDREKALEPGASILDVGCGPGTYSLPFAQRVKTVSALDGAGKMCDILKQRAEAKRIHNINVMNHLWKDVALDGNSMAHAFDLVFASMTPAVCDYDTLVKLNQASKRHCCLVSSVNGHGGKAREELWQRIFPEEKSEKSNSAIYIFNLLYSMGCRPSLQYVDSEWVREESSDKAVERFTRSFWLYTDITSDIRKAITQFVEERAENGLFREEIKSRLGVIIWEVDDVATS